MLSMNPLRPLADAWRSWRAREALRREFQDLDETGGLDATLADVGLSRAQIDGLLASDPASADLLPRMMRRFRLDPSRAELIPGMRDIEWTCTLCRAQRRCRNWLASETPGYPTFCPNAAALRQLARQLGH